MSYPVLCGRRWREEAENQKEGNSKLFFIPAKWEGPGSWWWAFSQLPKTPNLLLLPPAQRRRKEGRAVRRRAKMSDWRKEGMVDREDKGSKGSSLLKQTVNVFQPRHSRACCLKYFPGEEGSCWASRGLPSQTEAGGSQAGALPSVPLFIPSPIIPQGEAGEGACDSWRKMKWCVGRGLGPRHCPREYGREGEA